MSVGPPGDPRAKFSPVVVPPQFTGAHPRSKSAVLADSPEARALERSRAAESEAASRIRMAQERSNEAERAAEGHITEVRDEYEKRAATEQARQETAIQEQKEKGYAQIRDLQRAQQAEINRVRREGERELARVRQHFGGAIDNATRTGDQQLEDLRHRSAREQEHFAKTTEHDSELARSEHTRRMAELQAHQEERMSSLSKASTEDYEKIRANSVQAREESHEKFQSQFKAQFDQQQETLDRLNRRAGGKLSEIRQDTAQKLAAYESRQSDPFYKLLTVGAELQELDDAFVLTAEIPPHEQAHVSVAVRGNQLVLSGYRRNQEKLDLGQGRTQSTAAFQSYSESFPLSWPVESRQLTRTFEGDTLTITVPKQKLGAAPPTYQAKRAPARTRVETPKFPQNLPPAEGEATSSLPADLSWPDAPKPARGGKTLG
jgi:HSP20 family molecular chaperone IbpA